MAYTEDGPLRQVQDRILGLLKASERFSALVPAGALVDASDDHSPGEPPDPGADLPVVVGIEPAGGRGLSSEGAVTRLRQDWRIVLLTDGPGAGRAARCKLLVAASMARGGADLGLDVVERWSVDTWTDEPSLADASRRRNIHRRSDRADAAGGRRVLLRVSVELRLPRRDVSEWLGSVEGTAGGWMTVWINDEMIGSGPSGVHVQPVIRSAGGEAGTLLTVRFEEAGPRSALWGRLHRRVAAGADRTVRIELRDAVGDVVIAVLPRAVLLSISPAVEGAASAGRTVRGVLKARAPGAPVVPAGTVHIASVHGVAAAACAAVVAGHPVAVQHSGHVSSDAGVAAGWEPA